MDGEHITTVFTTEKVSIEFPCPTGADHTDQVPCPAQAVAYCLCGWAFVRTYDTGWANSVDVARTLASMQAREHRRNPLKEIL